MPMCIRIFSMGNVIIYKNLKSSGSRCLFIEAKEKN